LDGRIAPLSPRRPFTPNASVPPPTQLHVSSTTQPPSKLAVLKHPRGKKKKRHDPGRNKKRAVRDQPSPTRQARACASPFLGSGVHAGLLEVLAEGELASLPPRRGLRLDRVHPLLQRHPTGLHHVHAPEAVHVLQP
ncbi:unnamed protein product, partial [Ectocarpus sp. 6 AP-2014]